MKLRVSDSQTQSVVYAFYMSDLAVLCAQTQGRVRTYYYILPQNRGKGTTFFFFFLVFL